MRFAIFFLVSATLLVNARGQSDPMIATVQQKLKDQGFYYGESTGRKDADTTAALRRYQIRNGLQITGELNAETQKSLGVKGALPEPPKARPTPTPSIYRADPPRMRETPPAMEENFRDQPPSVAVPNGQMLFAGTPYENAAPETQRRIVASAQGSLARRGYYRDLIDGEFGPGTEFALRAFQSRFAMQPTGRFNKATLSALGLLPGQRAPGLAVGPGRGWLRARTTAPSGEPVYEGR